MLKNFHLKILKIGILKSNPEFIDELVKILRYFQNINFLKGNLKRSFKREGFL
jgi:hypothetical protein